MAGVQKATLYIYFVLTLTVIIGNMMKKTVFIYFVFIGHLEVTTRPKLEERIIIIIIYIKKNKKKRFIVLIVLYNMWTQNLVPSGMDRIDVAKVSHGFFLT